MDKDLFIYLFIYLSIYLFIYFICNLKYLFSYPLLALRFNIILTITLTLWWNLSLHGHIYN